MFKLALRNITSKPFRAAATVLAIAVAVAMIFAMLSFSPSVYEYIYSTQTATSGRSDIVISTNSSSDRITNVASPLAALDGVGNIIPSLSLYALLDGEYVQVRGFQQYQSEILQDIDIISKLDGGLNDDEANVIISKAAAKNFGLDLGDSVTLALGAKSTTFFVSAIAENSGYFLEDAPFLIIGRIEWVANLVAGILTRHVCNEIYIQVQNGADIDALIEEISAMPQYAQMLVQRTGDSGYIQEQANSLSAPVVLAGAAVLALGVAVIVLLFMMSESEKVSLIAKYSIVGATKKQILGIFLTESVLLACVGAVLGSALAVGVFTAILKLTLSPNIVFSISVWRLFGAAVLGLASAVISSVLPIMRAFKGTIRQNQVDVKPQSNLKKILCPIMIALTAICVIIEFAVPAATAVMAVVSLVFALATLGICLAPAMRIAAKASEKLSDKMPNPSTKVASVNIRRDGRFARSVTMLGVGMTVSMLLFMTWAMTKSVFSDYVSDFADMIFVTNVQSTVDVELFKQTDGVNYATKIVWQQGSLKNDSFDKTMNILGSKDALNLVDFGYITDRDVVESLLSISYGEVVDESNAGELPYVFLDKALNVLYGVSVGDTLTLEMDGKSAEVVVGGLLDHKLFSGNYIVMSDELILKLFGIAPDTVVLKAQGNMDDIVNGLRARFANNNYYVVDVLTAYKWDMQSMDAVFDLVGTLAIVVALFIFAVTVVATMVGRGVGERSRAALLNAGMSKRALLCSELYEHGLIALTSYVLSFALSALLTASLIHALRLFGLYFGFMYEAWVVALVGAVMTVGYTIVPVAFNFKKGYNIKKR